MVSSHEKAQRAKLAGASAVIDLSSQDPIAEVRALTRVAGADFAFDPVGGVVFSQLVRAIGRHGTVVSIGFTGGNEPTINLFDIIAGEKHIVGHSLHSEADEDLVHPFKELTSLAAKGDLRPVIDSTVLLEAVEDGYARRASRKAIGSIVVRL